VGLGVHHEKNQWNVRQFANRIDFAVVREQIEWLVEAGIHGFSTQLSAGEFAYLGLDERRSLTQVVVEVVNGRARSFGADPTIPKV
jgi:dihydrodipicolinate synthase/N-acetylneuraminate lyase